MSSGKGDYPVGYGRPPKEHRFRKGQSGNAKGRPKRARNFRTDVRETLKAPVPIVENGKPRTVSTQLAMLLRLREKALKGDTKALDRYLQLAGVYNNEEPLQAAGAQLLDADRAIIDRALGRLSAAATSNESEDRLKAGAEPTGGDDRGEQAAGLLPGKNSAGGDGE